MRKRTCIDWSGMRGTFFFRPLAIVLVLSLLPKFGPVAPISLVSEAKAQGGVCDPSPDRVIQDVCTYPGATAVEIGQFEQETLTEFLALTGHPASEASNFYNYARTDLRNQFRAYLLTRLASLPNKPDRTPLENTIYSWFRAVVQQRETAVYQAAVDDKEDWAEDPCSWEPDPDVAEQYGLVYKGGAFCSGGLATLFTTTPQVPMVSYFTTAAVKTVYGPIFAENPDFGKIVADVVILGGIFVLGVITALITETAILGFIGTTLPTIAGILKLGALAGPRLIEAIAFSGGVAAGAGAIIAVAVVIGAIAIFQQVEYQIAVADLQQLDDLLNQAQTSFPDLVAMAKDEAGFHRLNLAFSALTIPEFSSTEPLPSHGPDDPIFRDKLTGNVTTQLVYRDWNSESWTVEIADGWFVQQRNGSDETSFTTTLRYLDWDGNKRFATLYNGKFVVTNTLPGTGDVPCPVNPVTGISDQTGEGCSAYVYFSLEMQDGSGDPMEVELWHRPVFTSADQHLFQLGVPETVDIAATGLPDPAVLSSVQLPAGFSFESTGPGTGELSWSGAGASAGEWTVELKATNSAGTTTQLFTASIFSQVTLHVDGVSPFYCDEPGVCISPAFPLVDVTVGVPFSFGIQATGSPTPSLTGTCASGQGIFYVQVGAVTDNGGGTGVMEGVVPEEFSDRLFTCNVDATNAGSVATRSWQFVIHAPPPSLLPDPTSLDFTAGHFNSYTGSVVGGLFSPVYLDLSCPKPDWLSMTDYGNGQFTISGTPPYHAPDASFYLHAGFVGVPPPDECSSDNFSIAVHTVPGIYSNNKTVASVSEFFETMVESNEPSAQLAITSGQPPWLDFQPSNGNATMSGTPPEDGGGYYPLKIDLSSDPPATQFHSLYVLQPAGFLAPDIVNFVVDVPNELTVETTGFPITPSQADETESGTAMVLERTGVGPLPDGVDFELVAPLGLATGLGILHGTPTLTGLYPLSFTASNGIGPDATQDILLRVIIPGDLDASGVVNCADLEMVEDAYGTYLYNPGYNNLADANNDEVVDALDVFAVTDYLPPGTECAVSFPDLADDLANGLADTIGGYGLPNGTMNSFLQKIEQAQDALAKGNANAAANKLSALLNEINSQRGKKLTEEQADELIALVMQILLLI